MEEKEDVRRLTESELVHLRQEILLLGELQVKYKEKLKFNPASTSDKRDEMINVAFEQQIQGWPKKKSKSKLILCLLIFTLIYFHNQQN